MKLTKEELMKIKGSVDYFFRTGDMDFRVTASSSYMRDLCEDLLEQHAEIEQLKKEIVRRDLSSTGPNGCDYVKGTHQDYCRFCEIKKLRAEHKKDAENTIEALEGFRKADPRFTLETVIKHFKKTIEEMKND